VDALFQPHAGTTKVTVASRYEQSELFCIDAETTAGRKSLLKKKKQLTNKKQLSLF
jgi:hypothetical protein